MRQKMQLEMSLNNNLSLEQDPFASVSLPLTMALARKIRNRLNPQLRKYPIEWPFEDKVLALLLPNIIEKIQNFHNSRAHKLSLDLLYGPNLLEQLDGKLSEVLFQKFGY